MVPYVKNVILASRDQVAIDAVAATPDGVRSDDDPASSGWPTRRAWACGDVREIEIVGDNDGRRRELALRRALPTHDVRLPDAAPDLLGPLKTPIEWSLKTVLAPWAYLASVLYHDSFWYPLFARRQMRACLDSDWGRLFANWESLAPGPCRASPRSGRRRRSSGGPGAPGVHAVASHPRHDDSRSARASRTPAPGACGAPRPLSGPHRGGRAGRPLP